MPAQHTAAVCIVDRQAELLVFNDFSSALDVETELLALGTGLILLRGGETLTTDDRRKHR